MSTSLAFDSVDHHGLNAGAERPANPLGMNTLQGVATNE
jgi:hypothetical protein